MNAPPPSVKKKSYGPESEMWNSLKGKEVEVTFLDGNQSTGILAWVDFYTLGWDVDGVREILYKHGIRKVREV